jgi:hypothetical protein
VSPRNKERLVRRCDLLFTLFALLLSMIALTAPPGAEWPRYAAGVAWAAMIAALIIPRW